MEHGGSETTVLRSGYKMARATKPLQGIVGKQQPTEHKFIHDNASDGGIHSSWVSVASASSAIVGGSSGTLSFAPNSAIFNFSK